MRFQCELDTLSEYLIETEEIDYNNTMIQDKVKELIDGLTIETEIIMRVFEFVRDEISHSWDIQSSRVTRKASEVLYYKEGICYAKSNLLAALLRAVNIPTGFCYQKSH
nr:transglutaminase family protein [Desulfuribacillus stibiiarsenatis]